MAGSKASAGLEESIWLCPIEDRRQLDSPREGMLEGLSLGSYLLLVDYTGRLFRDGKAAISAELAGILERLGQQFRALVVADRKAQQGPPARPLLRGEPRSITRSGARPGRASPGEPGRLCLRDDAI